MIAAQSPAIARSGLERRSVAGNQVLVTDRSIGVWALRLLIPTGKLTPAATPIGTNKLDRRLDEFATRTFLLSCELILPNAHRGHASSIRPMTS